MARCGLSRFRFARTVALRRNACQHSTADSQNSPDLVGFLRMRVYVYYSKPTMRWASGQTSLTLCRLRPERSPYLPWAGGFERSAVLVPNMRNLAMGVQIDGATTRKAVAKWLRR